MGRNPVLPMMWRIWARDVKREWGDHPPSRYLIGLRMDEGSRRPWQRIKAGPRMRRYLKYLLVLPMLVVSIAKGLWS